MSEQIDELFLFFDQQSEKVKDRLSEVLKIVTEGKVPSSEVMKDLNDEVENLNEKYNSAYKKAKDIVSADELPAFGSALEEIKTSVEDSRSRSIRAQLSSAQNILKKFICVRSLIVEYANALSSYQKKAQNILDKLNENTIDDLISETEAPVLFLEAMESDNIHSTEGIELMKKVKEVYPEEEIQYGLVGKQFYFDNMEDENGSAETIGLEGQQEASKDLLAKDISKKGIDLDEDLPEFPDESDTESIMPIDNPAVEDDVIVIEGTLTAKNKVKMATPSASAFRKELAKMTAQYENVGSILSLFTYFGIMSKDQILLSFDLINYDDPESQEHEDEILKAVDTLADKGYLAKFDLSDLPDSTTTVFCLSNYCSGSMHKESIVHQMNGQSGISFGTNNLAVNTELDKVIAYLYYYGNVSLLFYLSAQLIMSDADKYEKTLESVKWDKDHYQVIAFIDEEPVNAYVIPPDTLDDISSVDAKYIIIVTPVCEIPDHFNDNCEKVFVTVLKNHKIYCCDPKKNIEDQISMFEAELESDLEESDEDLSELNDELKKETVSTETTELKNSGEAIEDNIEEEKNTEFPKQADINEISGLKQDARSDSGENEAESKEIITQKDILSGELTAQDLLDLGRIPSDEEFCSVIHSLLNQIPVNEESLNALIVEANLLARGAGLEKQCPSCKALSIQLQLATNVLRTDNDYSSLCLSGAFAGVESDSPALALSAYMYALIEPAQPYDFGLQNQIPIYRSNFDSYFPGLRSFKELFNVLTQISEIKPEGYTPAVIALLGDEDEKERFKNNLRNQAREYLTVKPPKTRMKALPIMYANEFGEGSDLYWCMSIISDGDSDSTALDIVEDVLSTFCDKKEDIYRINEGKIEKQLDKAWDNAISKDKYKLEYGAREQAIRQYKLRLDIMIPWTESIRNQLKNREELERLKKLKKNILDQINSIQKDTSWNEVQDANVLRWLLYYIPAYLNGEISNFSIYKDILKTGIFSLSEDGIPEIDTSFAEIKYYEVWRNALRHIVADRRSVEEITDEILGNTINIGEENKGLKDNLRQLSMIGKSLGSDGDEYIVTEQQIKEAERSADYKTEKFKDRLELAYTYYQIDETEKENLAGIMDLYKKKFYAIGDFACWRRFLNALEEQIQEYANGRKAVLNARLQEKLKDDEDAPILLETEKLIETDSNFVVAEEYLNRYEAGERNVDRSTIADKDYFSEFLSDDVFEPLYNICQRNKGDSLRNFGWRYIEKHLPKDWTSRLRDSSKNLILNFPSPSSRGTKNPTQIEALFKGLGFLVSKATKVNSREELWHLDVVPTEKSLADYLHPIAAFGTQMKSPLNVICLYGNHTPQQIVDTITSMNLGGISIVLISRPISISDRRLIGEIFHTQKSGQNPFLLIDQVLLLYLAKLQDTERMPALLKCTLPYATYQPFVRDAGSTADEMFCGRQQELATIIDHNGACVVYGGRQLGKTALLQRAESRCSKPEAKEFAVLSSIINLTTEQEVVDRLIRDINNKTNEKIALSHCATIRELCDKLEQLFRKKRIISMHLLIDEVDDFLGSIAADSYKPLQPLVELRRETKNNFKFVIAGLHNVCRAENATKNNGIFGQLGAPLCVKPLSPNDALQLLAKPLRYLGFEIDRYPHLETILAKSNYYPGILQFVGYNLVETLSGEYSKYYSVTKGNPPFTLLDEQLGSVMNSSDLNNSIKEKFRWSLELDPRYFMIARCITMLYLYYKDDSASGSWRGFAVKDIIDMAKGYDIHCLSGLTNKEYIILLDEMVEMGILGKPDKDKNVYRLRRNSFVDIIGNDIDVLDEEIVSNNL